MTNGVVGSKSVLKAIAEKAMGQRGLLAGFSAAQTDQAQSIGGPATESGPSIRDLRTLLWCSIDNDDSRDLDQLTVSIPAAGGAVRVLVAIADVDALVKKGSPIDEHARANTTTVYTPGAVFSMLPERLSTDLTSLNDGQDRLAVVADITVSADGQVTAGEVYRALVKSHAKLAYNSVAAWLDGTGVEPARAAATPGMAEQLRTQDAVAHAMRAFRHTQGALDLETLEAKTVFDGDSPTEVSSTSKNRASALIEDFMIAANGVTARFLASKRFATLRRVLKSPERWARIVELAAALQETLPAVPNSAALSAFLAKRRSVDPVHFADLSLSVVKLLGRGEYAVELPGQPLEGHFGLAVKDYTHSTAPNRRFPDLVTQRLLKAALSGQPSPYTTPELVELAAHCTTQEDNATKVERQAQKSASAMVLGARIGERFEGIVTGASAKGTWVRILKPHAEGKMISGFEHLNVGDRVRVELKRVDIERGFIDFTAAGAQP